MSELRWNPLLGQWVITATHRQDRTFFPPPGYCPLCPTAEGAFPTEIPAPDYDIVVFENKFPALRPYPADPAIEDSDLYPVAPAGGVCEVVCYTPEHESTLAAQPLQRIENLVDVWTDRFRQLGDRPEVDYVFIFENKGREIGVTLPHPHGQIYAFPFIPPILEVELASCRAHFDKTRRSLLVDIVQAEMADGRRIVLENDDFVAYVPFFARYPYEVHLTARTPGKAALTDFDRRERNALASSLRQVIRGYDALWDKSLPYILLVHQRPTDGGDYNHLFQFHIEFYPPYRTPDKLKYLAGSEAGAGTYINDTLAEEKAAELRAAVAKSA